MAEVTVEDFANGLPEGVHRPCLDCNGVAVWVEIPAPNGAHIILHHERGCPGFAATPAADRSADPREETP